MNNDNFCEKRYFTENSYKVFGDLYRPLIVDGHTFKVTKIFKEQRHGKSNIDAMSCHFKNELRNFETIEKGPFLTTPLENFVCDAEESKHGLFDAEKLLYRVNFVCQDVQLNDGSMAFNNVFQKLRDMPLVKDGISYKAGVRNIKSIKVVSSPENQDVVYAIALSTCPSACNVCYGEYQTFCLDVIGRHVKIPKEMFLNIPKRNFQPNPSDRDQPTTSKKRR